MASRGALTRRKLPKLMACMTKTSLENLRNKALFTLDVLDAKGIRRRRLPLHECLVLELAEAGFTESSDYLQDLIYDNIQLVSEDDIGIVVDLRNRPDYLEHICAGMQEAEKHKDKGNTKLECLELLKLALHYAEEGKGILWLAEKFFLAAIAVSSQYLLDGGRQKACCKYHYATFLLDKCTSLFGGVRLYPTAVTMNKTLKHAAVDPDKEVPQKLAHQLMATAYSVSRYTIYRTLVKPVPGADPEEPFVILTEVRDSAIGKDWLLYEQSEDDPTADVPEDTVFGATAVQLHRVLLSKARLIKKTDTGKAERLSRLAERRARDANELAKTAEAIIEIGICQLMMNNLNNALKTFERAYQIHTESSNVDGVCETKMHLAAVMQKMGDHESAAKLLTEMGALAMKHGLRRKLGRALHLLGELHLRREKPELGTQHLSEAFACFMGFTFQMPSQRLLNIDITDQDDTSMELIYKRKQIEVFEEEAEQSRLMMAVSAGQELMASYFALLREAHGCAVAQMKTIEWKLSRSGWWVTKRHHDYLPCMCPAHNRSPLDVMRIQLEQKEALESDPMDFSQSEGIIGRTDTVHDITKLRSSRLHRA